MRAAVRLAAGPLVADIMPSLGGGVARFDLLRDGRRIEVFRPCSDGGTDDPGELGLYVLVPWSNRISGSGFTFRGVFHPLAPNIADELCPIHGDGWLSSWRVSFNDDRRVRLEREAHGPGPYRYEATLDYTLDADAMTIRLVVRIYDLSHLSKEPVLQFETSGGSNAEPGAVLGGMFGALPNALRNAGVRGVTDDTVRTAREITAMVADYYAKNGGQLSGSGMKAKILAQKVSHHEPP
jgi:Aldose 1-epimerase